MQPFKTLMCCTEQSHQKLFCIIMPNFQYYHFYALSHETCKIDRVEAWSTVALFIFNPKFPSRTYFEARV